MENHPKKKLLELVREAIWRKHYSKRTEEAYIHWIKRYIFFHKKRHPLEMSDMEVEAFLTHLAIKKQVSASTQNQAFSALLFLYREVLNKPLEGPINSLRAKRPKKTADGSDQRRNAQDYPVCVGCAPTNGKTPVWKRAAAF